MKCLLLISLITISQLVSTSSAGFLGFGRKRETESKDVVVIAAGQSASPVVFKGRQGLNILLGGGGSSSGGGSAIVTSSSSSSSSSGGGGNDGVNQIVTNGGGSNPAAVGGGSGGDLATSASEPEPSALLSPTDSIAKSLTDLVTSESSPSPSRLSTPELFNKLMKMPASKFDRIADKLIEDALTGTANSILSSNGPSPVIVPPPPGAGSATSESSISSRTVPFIPLQAVAASRAGFPSFMSNFLPPSLKIPMMMAAAAASSRPVRVPVPITTIRLPVYVPDVDDDSFEDTSSSSSSNRPSGGHQASSSNQNRNEDRPGGNFDESKIPPPVKDHQPSQSNYDDQASFERPNFGHGHEYRPYYINGNNERPYESSSYNDRPRAEPYSTNIEHSSASSSDSSSDSLPFPPSTSAHSGHRPYPVDDDGNKPVIHSYSTSIDHGDHRSGSGASNDDGSSSASSFSSSSAPHSSSNYHNDGGSRYLDRPQMMSMTSASSPYPLLPSYTQSLPFSTYPIPMTAFNSLSPNAIPMFAASSPSSKSSSNPFIHSSAHPLTHLNKLLHNGYVSDIRKIPQPFSYNHNYGLGKAARGMGSSRGPNSDYEKLQATLAQQLMAASSTSSSTSTRSSRGSFFSRPFLRPLFGSNSVLSRTFTKAPPNMVSKGNSISSPVPFGSTPLGQATRTFGSPPTSSSSVGQMMMSGSSPQKSYPILDTSSSVPKVYHAPHNPVDILKIFADAYGKQNIGDVSSSGTSNKYSRSSSPSSGSSGLTSSLFKTRSLFSRPLLTSRSGVEKMSSFSPSTDGPELKAIVTILPTEASFPISAIESSNNNHNKDVDTMDTTETRHFPIFVKADPEPVNNQQIVTPTNVSSSMKRP